MKRPLLLIFSLLILSQMLFAQCSELFFSEYVEGYANNKALEIYNPTNAPINLSGYSIARFSNGSTTANEQKVINLPNVMLNPYATYVVVVDLTDMSQWDTQFDKPVWNGYNLIDTLFDSVTGMPILDDEGNVVLGPQYNDNGAAIFGDEYNEEYDLQCKANTFLCPDYDTNNAMYFNGNDAVALITGTEVAVDGSNLVDVIGVIGEDPEVSIGEDAWVDSEGYWLTKDRTLVRKPEVAGGRNDLSQVVAQAGGTFMGEEWISHPKNSFQFLRTHNCDCNPTTKPDEVSCSTFVYTTELNQIPFKLFPNPTASGILHIEAPENVQAVKVYNFMGQSIFNLRYQNASGRLNIDLSHLSGGMYLVELTFENQQRSIEKLVID